MRLTYFLTTSFLIVLIGFFTACNEPIDPPTSNYEIITVNADVTSNTTWTEGNVYVINKPDFYVEAELSIEPGVIVKFPSNYAYLTLGGEGKILANGTSDMPIVFTSYKDDTNGEDTNDDGNATSPSKGDWASIDLNGKSGSVFRYCEFYYGGAGTTPSLKLSAGSDATIEHCVFAYNTGGLSSGYYIGALDATDASNNTIIRNNVFYNNELPLTIFSEINIDNTNSFYKSGNGNTMNGIFVSGNIGKNTIWQETEVAYVITSFDLQIYEGNSLVLGDNVVVKFVEDSRLNLIGGESVMENYDGDGVHFTSIKDDTRKGDTNGDLSSSTPAEADWLGIFLDDYKGGYADWPNIHYNNPNAVVK